MSDFAPPVGPPPPKVPEGWKAVFNAQYQEWFYVNIYTKQSQWEKPIEPIYPPYEAEGSAPPPGPPPSYGHGGDARPLGPEKTGLSSNNPYGPGGGGYGGSGQNISEDERLARQLQAEEDARAHGGHSPMPGGGARGASDGYYAQQGGSSASPGYGSQQPPGYGQQAPGYGSQELPPRAEDSRGKKSGGFLGKLLGKASGSRPGGGYGQQQPQYGGYQQPQGYNQGPPQGQYGYAPQQGYYGQQGGGMPYGGVQQKPKKGGLGAGGAAALGVGGGLVGGMLLADAIDDHDEHEYEQGYDQGYDNGNDGDFGGGDDFGVLFGAGCLFCAIATTVSAVALLIEQKRRSRGQRPDKAKATARKRKDDEEKWTQVPVVYLEFV
ncbi:hypothetical protein SLS58_002301 [Diplodia intermedia]|uniref:WW domain-containing protein n=1 Tax=Diplodia intermedia TaxID=856260 RepID=A0ABR3TZU8_9PEZI